MIGRICVSTLNIGNKADHEVRLIHHGPYRFFPRPAIEAEHLRTRRSRIAAGRGGSLACSIVRAWPRMIGKRKGSVAWMNAERTCPAQHRMVAYSAQYLVGLGLVVIDTLSIAPTVGRKVKRHGEVFFAIRRRAG